MSKSQNIFDNQEFFDGYKRIRSNKYSANNLEEKPALFSLSPDLSGKAVLDLGCGYGENCAEFKERGASAVLGIDISEKMLEIATAEHPDIDFLRADMSDLSFIKEKYDVVFSSLAVHYVEDFAAFVRGVYDVLNPGGYFIFSQEHPLTTCFSTGDRWTKDADGNKIYANISDYSVDGERETRWFIDGVKIYHRSFSTIVNTLVGAGFVVERFVEPIPTEELLREYPEYADLLHKPDFLLVRARES